MEVMKYFYLSFALFVCVAGLSRCGSGNFVLDTSQGVASNVVGNVPADVTPEEYFTNNIFPIVKNTSGIKGCALSGCHNVNDSPSHAQTFFQVDPSSASNSWNWASARRTTIVVGPYATSSAIRILTRSSNNHENFSNWTSAEKTFISTWAALSE
jgi:hypothetical protein